VSYYEECLRLGQWLGQEDSRALYKFLLTQNLDTYNSNANYLMKNCQLTKVVANGEILYLLEDNKISYQTRKIGTNEFSEKVRELNLGKFKFKKIRKLQKFFAQTEVDVIQNFPLPGANIQSETSLSVNTYPFYELKYYSNGRSRIVGLINKLRSNDFERVRKLSA
jgi:hypothetical protein